MTLVAYSNNAKDQSGRAGPYDSVHECTNMTRQEMPRLLLLSSLNEKVNADLL